MSRHTPTRDQPEIAWIAAHHVVLHCDGAHHAHAIVTAAFGGSAPTGAAAEPAVAGHLDARPRLLIPGSAA
eukprot:364653-Chlamydomonas_euryale.AAC.9